MLRLMSVFKEAFNQIYSNEDEISEAWENFVNNLSASVVEGSEPDVTLTWTDDSVNFEFTMVPGVPGEQGVGITSISFNSDYTMTITLSNGQTYTSMSLKGETGPQGPQGETGSGLQILDVYATLADLQSAHPTGQPGDAYQVGSAGNYILYIWSSSQSAWVQAGTLGTVSPYTSAPLMDGTASAGSQNLYSRGDHVHPSDTSRASKEEMDALIKTSQALIDQSFIYRESPAIQDGLARIDKIKGNTLVWNQLAQKGDGVNNGCTSTYDSATGETTITPTNYASNSIGQYNLVTISALTANHKYFCSIEVMADYPLAVQFGFGTNHIIQNVNTISYTRISNIFTWTNSSLTLYGRISSSGWADGTYKFKNVQCFDLTQMFGSGNEPTAVEFDALFPSYYPYDSGSLLSFNGTGVKTVGKNLLDVTVSSSSGSGITYTNENKVIKLSGATTGLFLITTGTVVLPKGSYALSGMTTNTNQATLQARLDNQNGTTIATDNGSGASFTLTEQTTLAICVRIPNGQTLANDITISPMVRFADTDSTFVPYEEHTTSLPTLTYFPTGMKSAGSVYDELTPSKAITRIGAVDLGSLTWIYSSTTGHLYFNSASINTLVKKPSTSSVYANIKCPKYNVINENEAYNNTKVGLGIMTNGAVRVYDPTYTTVESFVSAMSGVYLYYELVTPTETAVDLDLDFNAYEDGTEQLLPINGSVPSTSPIIADMTYLSIDDAMAYILEKLESIPEQTEQRLEALEDDVADLQTDVGDLQPAVSSLQTSVGNINTNIGQLSSTVAGHTASISDIQSDITDLNTDLGDLEDTVTDNTSRISTLETDLESTNGRVTNISTSVSGLESTVTSQGTTVTALDSIIQDISNNAVSASLGQHELGFVAAYVDATLPANTGTMVTIPKPTIFPSNYTPLFIVGMTTGSYNVSICSIPWGFGSGDSVTCRVWNHGSQQTTQITVYILCMRQRQSQ